MLEGELDGHLDYDRHKKSNQTNSRNGYSKKKVRTSFGESEIVVPKYSHAMKSRLDNWQELTVFFEFP
jgi:transposase-like protein